MIIVRMTDGNRCFACDNPSGPIYEVDICADHNNISVSFKMCQACWRTLVRDAHETAATYRRTAIMDSADCTPQHVLQYSAEVSRVGGVAISQQFTILGGP